MEKQQIRLACGCPRVVNHDRGALVLDCAIHNIKTVVQAVPVKTIVYDIYEPMPTLFDKESAG